MFIDAFSQGQQLTRTELQDILLHIVPDSTNPDYLRAVRNSDVWCVLRDMMMSREVGRAYHRDAASDDAFVGVGWAGFECYGT